MNYRNSFVAGRFYPKDKESILNFVLSNLSENKEKTKAIGLIVPHAGHIFSGKTAIKVFEKNIIPNNIIILSPNHTSLGSKISIDDNDYWKTPLGSIKVNKEISNYIVTNCKYAKYNKDAQIFEHAIEVIIPFIQFFNPDAKIVPITIAEENIKILEDFSNTLYNTINKFGFSNCLIISSSDMTHFEKAEIAEKQDEVAIKEIIKFEPFDFYKYVISNKISICGVFPITVLLFLVKRINSINKITCNLVDYTNSATITQDYNDVVSYASLEFLL